MQSIEDTSLTPTRDSSQDTSGQLTQGASDTHASTQAVSATKESQQLALTILEVLEHTEDWAQLTDTLERQIDPVFKYPLYVTSSTDGQKIDLAVSVDAYKATVYTNGTAPTFIGEGYTLHHDVSLSYTVKNKPKIVGKVHFVVTDDAGNVVEVGASSKQTLQIFKEHIFGKTYTAKDVARLYTLNEKLISALRENPTCTEKLAEFNKRREHQQEWSDRAQLAYYDPQSFDIIGWAKENKIDFEDLYHAGFVDRTVSGDKVRYRPKTEPVVFIPFSDDEGRIVLWRQRVINPREGMPKYRSAPLERSDRFPASVHRELYQANLLKDVRGKPLIITEGEFKCMVATQLTGITTVGITGITQVTDLIIQKIVEAGPSQVIVILDRDPKAKGYNRTDELTDSERAAFSIAERLRRAGHSNVTVGTLTDRFNGGKVGIDDLLLDIMKKEGQKHVRGALEKIIEESLDPQRWLQKRSNDPGLQDVLARKQRLRQVIRDFTQHLRRSGEYPQESEQRVVAEARLARATSMLDSLMAAEKRHLKENYKGARRINQPPLKFLTLFPTAEIRDQERKCVVTRSGSVIPLTKFTDHIISLRVTPKDLPKQHLKPGPHATGLDFAFSMASLTKAYYHPKQGGGKDAQKIGAAFRLGCEILGVSDQEKTWSPKTITHSEFVHRVLVGWLAEHYPPDEYHYERDVRLAKVNPTHWEDITTIPLAIFKEGQKPVAFCFMPHWDSRGVAAITNERLTLDESSLARQEAIENLAGLAAFEENRLRSAVRTALRDPQLATQREKLGKVFACISSVVGVDGARTAQQHLKTLGISDTVAKESGAVILRADQTTQLIALLSSRKLINQAVHSGLLCLPEGHFAEPRFTGNVILLPEISKDGKCIGLNVLPLSEEQRSAGTLPPAPKRLFPVDSIRSTTQAFDRGRSFFPASEFQHMQGKTVLVASSELECLQLRSLVELAQVPDTIVIGIRELDSISRSEYQRLAKAGPKKVIFVGQAAEANEFGIRYASLALRDPSTYAATYLRANPDGAPPVSAILLREELAHVLVELLKKSHAAERFLGELLEQPRFRPDERTLAKLQFSELLADLECVIALHNEGQEFPFDIRQAVDALRGLYHIASAGGRELEQFLSDRYRVREDEALMAFERGFHKPNYRPGTPSKMQVRKLVAEDLKRRFRSVEMLKERFRLEHNPAVDGELSKLRALNDAEFEGDTASNSATAAAQIITAMKQAGDLGLQPPIHQSHSVLGRTNHTIEIPLEFRGAKFAVRGNGPTRKIAEDAAWREAKKTIYRAAAKLPSLLELYAKLGAVFAARSRIQDTLKDRKCFRSLKREVEALNRHGVAVSITEGKQQQRPDKSWVVPITLSFEGEAFEASFEGPTPHVAKELAAAKLIVTLREKLSQKRLDPDFDEPKTMVQDLNYLGETLKAEISKSQPSVGGEEGTRLYSFCWSLSLGGTRLEGRGTDHKKIDAERHAAAALLRELEKIDPVNCILEWS